MKTPLYERRRASKVKVVLGLPKSLLIMNGGGTSCHDKRGGKGLGTYHNGIPNHLPFFVLQKGQST